MYGQTTARAIPQRLHLAGVGSIQGRIEVKSLIGILIAGPIGSYLLRYSSWKLKSFLSWSIESEVKQKMYILSTHLVVYLPAVKGFVTAENLKQSRTWRSKCKGNFHIAEMHLILLTEKCPLLFNWGSVFGIRGIQEHQSCLHLAITVTECGKSQPHQHIRFPLQMKALTLGLIKAREWHSEIRIQRLLLRSHSSRPHLVKAWIGTGFRCPRLRRNWEACTFRRYLITTSYENWGVSWIKRLSPLWLDP